MRHLHSGRKLNRTKSHRKALFANLATALVEHEKIKTTLPKAKDLRPIVEKYVTLAKRGDLSSYRMLIGRLRSQEAAKKLMENLAARYKDRQGGYLRIVKAGFRYGDNAPMAVIEFVDRSQSEGAQPVDKKVEESSQEEVSVDAQPAKASASEGKKKEKNVKA